MASAKTKTDATQTTSVPAANADATTTPVAIDVLASGRKLRWTSLPLAGAAAHRTKKTKAKKAATKTQAAHTSNDAVKSDKLCALDAAAKVLQEAARPLNCQELIKAMADQGYWTSPAGKTPASTLYAALAREITTKGKDSRFVKTERGKFAVNV
jgi:hypothetical protein